jgi:DNA-binding NarL/FixJ family response regulator
VPRKPAARLLIADDHKILADLCKQMLEPEFEVIDVVTDGRSLIRAAGELKPDIIVVDINMPQLNGLDAGEQIKKKFPRTKLVYLTMNMSAEIAAEAFRRGASAFVLKQSAAEELRRAVHEVLKGQTYLSPLIAGETVAFLLNQSKSKQDAPRPTSRENEVLQLLAEGKSMKEVAAILDISTGTVAFHKYKMMEKLGLKSNAELLEYAIKRKMTPES